MENYFNYIINPNTGRKVSVYGVVGRKIIHNYINQMNGGSIINLKQNGGSLKSSDTVIIDGIIYYSNWVPLHPNGAGAEYSIIEAEILNILGIYCDNEYGTGLELWWGGQNIVGTNPPEYKNTRTGLINKFNKTLEQALSNINLQQLNNIKTSLKMVIKLRLKNQEEFDIKSDGHLYFINQLISGVEQIIQSGKKKKNYSLQMLNTFTQVLDKIATGKIIQQQFINTVNDVIKDTRDTRKKFIEYGLSDVEIEIVNFLSDQPGSEPEPATE